MRFIPNSLVKICHLVQNLKGGTPRQHYDLIRLFLFLKNEKYAENNPLLKMGTT
jgi:hypothetical protein